MNNNYTNIHNKVRSLINDYDPLDLMSASAPEDEYDAGTSKAISIFVNKKKEPLSIRVEELKNELIRLYGSEADKGADKLMALGEGLQAVLSDFDPSDS